MHNKHTHPGLITFLIIHGRRFLGNPEIIIALKIITMELVLLFVLTVIILTFVYNYKACLYYHKSK